MLLAVRAAVGNAERGKKLASSRALSSGLHLHPHGIRPQVEQTRISSHELLDEEDEAAGARLGDLDAVLSLLFEVAASACAEVAASAWEDTER